MCGIAGILGDRQDSSLRGLAVAMADTMIRRGPDSGGVWSDDSNGIALAHRRLAVLDLSPAGHQPMRSRDGRYVVTFNGEIYNHLELRAELRRANGFLAWRGGSDTETLVEAVAAWGVVATLTKLRGMFALGLWDSFSQKLTLARDPLGEKPLYYGHVGNRFVFASEVKAICTVPGWQSEIDREALDFYTRYSYVPAPASIFRSLRKLEAGTMLVVSSNDRTTAVLRQYAGVRERPLSTLRWTIRNEKEAAKELEARISNSVRERMMSDVPLGALFSGGIDSTTVVAMMQRASPHPVKTFTVGFDERAFNEAAHARRLAAYLGTDHHEIYVRARDALDVIPELPEIWDEPFADPSQLPCYIVSRFARQHVTVALAGDGGDELFCGYRHYAMAGRMHRLIHVVPGPVRRALATATRAAAGLRLCLGPARARLAERAARVGHVLASHSVEEFCESLLAVYQDAPLVLGCTGGIPRLFDCDPKRLVECLMEGDLLRYLPENIMTKTDRASMGVSLEIRAPFLDPALVDFARSIPLDLKLRNGQSKWLLRQVLYGLVPRDLVDRPKTGFSVPLARWLNCELLPWAEELLSVPSLMKSDVFHVERVRAIWHEHREGLRLRQRVLWNVLMFQAWWFRTQRRATLIASPVKVSQ